MKLSKPTEAPEMKTIKASYDQYKEWRMDPAGYFLIRHHNGLLEIGLCRKDNVIETKIVGKTPEEIYNTVVRENITRDPTHVAYLGNELQKALVAMQLGIPYVQDSPLDLTTVVKIIKEHYEKAKKK